MEWFLPTPVPSLTIALSLISETTAFTVEGEEKARFTSTSAATAVFERPVASKDGMEDELAVCAFPSFEVFAFLLSSILLFSPEDAGTSFEAIAVSKIDPIVDEVDEEYAHVTEGEHTADEADKYWPSFRSRDDCEA